MPAFASIWFKFSIFSYITSFSLKFFPPKEYSLLFLLEELTGERNHPIDLDAVPVKNKRDLSCSTILACWLLPLEFLSRFTKKTVCSTNIEIQLQSQTMEVSNIHLLVRYLKVYYLMRHEDKCDLRKNHLFFQPDKSYCPSLLIVFCFLVDDLAV